MGILDQAPEEFEYVDYRPQLNQSLANFGGALLLKARQLKKKGMKTPKKTPPKKTPPKVPPKPAHLRVKGGGKVGKKGGSAAVNQSAFGQRGGEDLPMYSRGAGPAPAYSPKVPPSRVKPRIPGKSPAAVTAAQGKPPGYSPPVPKKSAVAKARQKAILDAQPKQGSLKRSKGFSEGLNVVTKRKAPMPAKLQLKRVQIAAKRKAPMPAKQQLQRVKNAAMMEAFQREAAKTYKPMPKKGKGLFSRILGK